MNRILTSGTHSPPSYEKHRAWEVLIFYSNFFAAVHLRLTSQFFAEGATGVNPYSFFPILSLADFRRDAPDDCQ
jgi:hypothetical protein